MALRKGHGAAAGKPHVETLPADELPRPLTRTRGTRAPTRIPWPTRAIADEIYLTFTRAADTYTLVRSGELAALAGGTIGAGPSALVASSAHALADARYMRTLALAVEDPTQRAALLVQAGRCEANSRQCELAAYELAVREGQVREQSAPATWDLTDAGKRRE